MLLSPAILCKLEEPSDTIFSHIYSANSYSPSSIDLGFEPDLYKNSLDMFIKIWKMLLIAWSNLEADASTGLFLQSQFRVNHDIVGQWQRKNNIIRLCQPLENYNPYLGETSLKNSQAWRRKSGADSRKPQLLGVDRKPRQGKKQKPEHGYIPRLLHWAWS